jgi:hypothetical protein
MSRRGPEISLPALLFIAFIVVAALAIPINPQLTVTFRISTNPQTYATLIEVSEAAYAKVSIWSSASIPKGNISLSLLGATQGRYTLSVVIVYNGQIIGSTSYLSIGDGLYQMRVVYLPRIGEQASIPYYITFNVFLPYSPTAVATTSVTLFPS